MTEPPIPPHENFSELVKYFKKANDVYGTMQKDISLALLSKPAMRKKLAVQLKMSESDAEVEVTQKCMDLMEEMPRATMNGYNLFGKLFAMHANITGDPTMHDVFDEVNRQVFDEMEDH